MSEPFGAVERFPLLNLDDRCRLCKAIVAGARGDG
jgi:hypothetical protein